MEEQSDQIDQPKRRLSVRAWVISQIAVTLLLIFVIWATKSYVSQTPINLDQSARLQQCRVEIQKTLNAKEVTLELLGEIHGLCYARVDEEDILQEFGVRRSAYINQQYQVPIMLWMVVAITLSGVALAGLQLLAGYRLASSGRSGFEPSGNLTIEPKKIAINSTVTGVLILFISLAFFYVFVKYVYLIKELPVPAANSEAGTPDLHKGWGQQPAQIPTGNLGFYPGLQPQSGKPITDVAQPSKVDSAHH